MNETKMLSCRISEALYEAIEAEATSKKQTITETVTKMLQEQVSKGPQRSKFEALLYEVVKTRAVMIRVVDPDSKTITKELCKEAGEDAKAYLEERRKES